MEFFRWDEIVICEPVVIGTQSDDVAGLVLASLATRVDPVTLDLVLPVTSLYLAVLRSK